MFEAEDLDYLSYSLNTKYCQIQSLSFLYFVKKLKGLQEQKNLKEMSQFLGEEQKISKYLYPKFTELEVEKSPNFQNFKTILFIGQTGTGKTTSINFFFNFFLGVKFEDNFRFLLINEKTVSGTQAVSQTQDVNIYYVKPFNGNPALRIIDTPGLGDTRGLQQDKINIDKITSLFQNQIDTVTTICFVLKASDNRLAESFNLIITAFLQMFGNDIIKIFACLILCMKKKILKLSMLFLKQFQFQFFPRFLFLNLFLDQDRNYFSLVQLIGMDLMSRMQFKH